MFVSICVFVGPYVDDAKKEWISQLYWQISMGSSDSFRKRICVDLTFAFFVNFRERIRCFSHCVSQEHSLESNEGQERSYQISLQSEEKLGKDMRHQKISDLFFISGMRIEECREDAAWRKACMHAGYVDGH